MSTELARQPGSSTGRHAVVPTRPLSIGEYLIKRLQDYGIRDIFGIPGDYILGFYSMVEKSPINVVGCTREDCAGFAADAYARINGMCAVAVTYCVGGLSVANSIAGAYAEKSAVVLIAGSPGVEERRNNPLLHHKVKDFRTQAEVFEKLCLAAIELTDPVVAFREIDRVLDIAHRFKRPVYIELPRDMTQVVPQIGQNYHREEVHTDPQAMQEAADEAVMLLNKAERPVMIAGVEMHRFGLQAKVAELIDQSGLAVAATLLGKSVIRETHPRYLGIYEGAMGPAEVTQFVEESDCVLLLGAFMTDINLGIYTANLDPAKCIYVTSEQLRIRHHHYHSVDLGAFMDALLERKPVAKPRAMPKRPWFERSPFVLEPEKPITITRMMARLNEQITTDTIVIADIGDALFAAADLIAHEAADFLSPAYYTSMGFSAPATLGACVARPNDRVIAICGDGAFQMTGMELSNVVRRKYNPIFIVLDNHGYGTERFLHAGKWEYNDINPWNYAKLPEVFGGGTGYVVNTEGEFDDALTKAWADTSAMSLIQVKIDENDISNALRRLGERLGQRI
jgi:indolepyruvate decarboxylase